MSEIKVVELTSNTCGNCIFRVGLSTGDLDPENRSEGYTELCDLVGGMTKKHFEACSDHVRIPETRKAQ
jgi:hypothetical protein